MTTNVLLRDVTESDLPIFFAQQLDPDDNHMAAFTSRDPSDREAFMAHWRGILKNDAIITKTIVADGEVAGNIVSFEEFGEPEVGYWLGKSYWGKGIATKALVAFLEHATIRPLYAHVAKDNVASRRVLEKCGFVIIGEDKSFANARGAEIAEFILELTTRAAS